MLALPSSSEAGKRLRAKRERRQLSIRDVERFSQRIVEEKKNPAYYVPHNWVSDLENGKSTPRLEKLHGLSLIYKCDISEILACSGLISATWTKNKDRSRCRTCTSAAELSREQNRWCRLL